MRTVDERIDKLLSEADAIRGLDDEDANFVRWRKRAETAVAEKLGRQSDEAQELRGLTFFYSPIFWTEGTVITPEQHRGAFTSALNTAVAILTAAREAASLEKAPPASGSSRSGPTVHVHSHGGSATSNASARVSVQVTVEQLRVLIASAPELTPGERSEAIDAIPDEGESLDIEKVDKLLSIATKSKDLLTNVLGWILGNAGNWSF